MQLFSPDNICLDTKFQNFKEFIQQSQKFGMPQFSTMCKHSSDIAGNQLMLPNSGAPVPTEARNTRFFIWAEQELASSQQSWQRETPFLPGILCSHSSVFAWETLRGQYLLQLHYCSFTLCKVDSCQEPLSYLLSLCYIPAGSSLWVSLLDATH